MALHWRPVGPEPSSTYWRRRAALAAVLLLLLVLLTRLLSGDDGPDSVAAPSPAPQPASPPAAPTAVPTAQPAVPTAGPSPPGPPICQPEALKIQASADRSSYRVGSSPRLSLSVENTGGGPCTRDLGQAAVELLVTSGEDRIWSSDDCAPGGAERVTTLQPRKPVVQRVTWDARRSRPGCTGGKERAEPGTYRVTGRVGQLRVEGDAFRFTR
ncbi:MAG: hypothetical protein WD794_17110 [Mycobacteriales bacterium]